MSQFTRHSAYTRPDSRASQASGYNDGLGGGRFTNALSAAIKRDDAGWPGHQAGVANVPVVSSPEEQLEEIEQKVTLALQAIDANFDRCQRTMARSVMPKVERLAQLSSELLSASQPWLQFFMAVASADDEQGLMSSVMTLDGNDSRPAGLAQQRVVEEMPRGGEITARFPSSKEEDWEVEDEEDDIDADIATPQLTSRFMTQELGTPAAIGRKRLAEQLGSVSAKKRRVGGGTPMKTSGASGAAASSTAAPPRTPVSLMRALVGSKERRGMPGSAASFVSKSSSLGTADLMPETSPPHTTTFTLPTSRRSRVAPAIQQNTVPEEEEDDELMDQVNVMLSRYKSPASGTQNAMSVSSVASVRSVGSVASVMSVSSMASLGSAGREGRALAAKYASPEEVRVQGLRADMEEMLDEIEAAQQQDSETPADEASASVENVELEDDLDDDIPPPPQISSNLEGSSVVVPVSQQNASDEPVAAALAPAPVAVVPAPNVAATNVAATNVAATNVAARQAFADNILRMELEEMDNENMTIGHMSPLANRGRARLVGPDPRRQTSGVQFHALGSTLDDPFGPTPERPPRTEHSLRQPGSEQQHASREYPPDSAQSIARSEGGMYSANASTWDVSAIGRRVTSALGSDATATFDEHAREGVNGQLSNDNSLTIDGFTQEVATIDGTTTILPTREMLQRAAAQAAESEASAVVDDQASAVAAEDENDDSFMFTADLQDRFELVQVFDLEAFPPAFRSEPAAGQLRELWEMMRATERIWTLAQVMEDARARDEGRLGGLGDSVFAVLLDLLERRRLLRKVSDGLWTAH
ncbi:hypothetical protein LPJ53_002888 [Coemansia erecta]|uniref:DASH complex subunit ASK1 n=1 Tax=Coemansia erecta TaxID=147472 RepID=A0A9W7Y3A6_9FUNG|nr:hypothetical protein LPJ53_002888 [Coemansia erecta]